MRSTAELKDSDIGKKCIYRDSRYQESGKIISWDNGWIIVAFDNGNVQQCLPFSISIIEKNDGPVS